MKIYNIKNVNTFFDVIDQCKGDVLLLTKDGDELNLKSKLSQYVSLTKFFGAGTIPELEIKAKEPKDLIRLTNYLISA